MNFHNINIINNQSKILLNKTADIKSLVQQYADNINMPSEGTVFTSFAKNTEEKDTKWIDQNDAEFLHNTPNTNRENADYLSECGFVYCMTYTPDGQYLIVGHSTGLIQMRHGSTGAVLSTLRNVQFPPRPVYALYYSRSEENVCYAACMNGVVYRIDIPHIKCSTDNPPEYCIKADPALESLHTQFYGSPGTVSVAAPFVSSRSPALCLGVLEAEKKIIVGYGDASVKVFDMVTQEVEETYKVHKLRLEYIVKRLQRMHAGQVCALKCHEERPCTFATGAWDNTIRIWDTRCKVGCMMTFEGVNVCSDSIDLNRDHCVAGSWQPTEALTVWDIVAKRRLNIVRVQNRRPDVDGEYIYACRYWRSSQYNRKGKYGIIGGSGTGCVEVINLHNRYISASYAVPGSILAVTSHGERIAFGGTAPVISIASFHDPKHEQYEESEDSFDLVWDGWNRSSVDANSDESKDANIPESKDPNIQEKDFIKRLSISELEDQVIDYVEKIE